MSIVCYAVNRLLCEKRMDMERLLIGEVSLYLLFALEKELR